MIRMKNPPPKEHALESTPYIISTLLEIINSGIIVSNLEQRIVFINKKAALMFNVDREYLVGEKLEVLFMEEDRHIFLPNIPRDH